jgi:hypothetical protein
VVFFRIRGPQDAGACVGRWEWFGFSLAGLRLAKGPVVLPMPPWGRSNAARNTTQMDATRREQVVSGLRFWIRRSHR